MNDADREWLIEGDPIAMFNRLEAAEKLNRELLDALIAVDSEVMLTGNLKDIVDATIAKAEHRS